MFNNRKKTELLISRTAEVMAEYIRDKLNDTGIFPKYAVSFNFPDKKITGMLVIEPDLRQFGEKHLSACAFAVGDDHLVKNYIMKGSRDELIAWLTSPECLPDLIEIFSHLKERAKEF